MRDPLPTGPRGAVLLTGASGFLGAQVARRLLACTDYTIYALIRAADSTSAAHRLSRAWWDWPELAGAIGNRVQVLAGDVGQARLGLSEDDYAGLVAGLTHIVHTAADLRVNAPIAELRKTNLQGTEHVLELAQAAQADHGLARYAHVSTAYVAGGRTGPVPEDALTDAYGFSCAYEFSKYEGERLVQAARADLPISVFRPGMIVGDSATGEIKTFNTLYFPLRLYLDGRLPLMPASRTQRVNLVPVDYVADAIVRLTLAPEAAGLNFHLTAPYATLPQIGELVAFVRALGTGATWPPAPPAGLSAAATAEGPLRSRRGRRHGRRASWLPCARSSRTSTSTWSSGGTTSTACWGLIRSIGANSCPIFWLTPSMRVSCTAPSARCTSRSSTAWAARTGRSPTTTSAASGIVTRSGQEVRQDVLAAMAALKSLGIGPGDRVAIAGTNSTRYLTLDVAIGMLGAVSVPVYYTSPPADIDHILAASGARLLFVGFNRVLERLGELRSDAPVISFGSDPAPAAAAPAAAGARPVMAWEAFLALGRQQPLDPKPQSPVGFGDLATLRYTSGTTGRPKGVMFRHDGLRWMGETMAALLPWRARTRRARYLSFLPLNHVVEGILVAYAGYYIPQALDIYFLEDFRQAQRYLPQVKPTFFFSVPRVFERAWEGLEESRPGKFYLGLTAGPVKNALRPLLRWSLLGKLGLRAAHPAGHRLCCRQREAAAEFPRAGDRAPQRLRPHRGAPGHPQPRRRQPHRHGRRPAARNRGAPRRGRRGAGPGAAGHRRLLRGGRAFAGPGRLAAHGRPGTPDRRTATWSWRAARRSCSRPRTASMSSRPRSRRCCATSPASPRPCWWARAARTAWRCCGSSTRTTPRAEAAISQAMAELSRGLSHPEQVKRWAVLRNDLSIERGDLTANLKLKRQAVGVRLQGLIEALYDGSPADAAVLSKAEPGSLCDSFLFAGEAARD